MSAYLAVFMSSLFWAISTQIASKMVNKITVYRFNLYKSVLIFVYFLVASLIIGKIFIAKETMLWLFLSGFLGLGLADLLIFYSFAKNGPARTLMLSSFEPSIIAIYSYFILGKTLPMGKVVGLFFLVLCICFMALERKRRGSVSLYVAALALLGINIEALGVVFTKKAFMLSPELSSMTANLYRVIPAVGLLLVYDYFKKVKMGIDDLSGKTKATIFGTVFLGGFLALYLYVYALSNYDHPSIIAGLGSLSPIYASIYEHWRDKKYPNRYFIGAILSMIVGILILIFV